MSVMQTLKSCEIPNETELRDFIDNNQSFFTINRQFNQNYSDSKSYALKQSSSIPQKIANHPFTKIKEGCTNAVYFSREHLSDLGKRASRFELQIKQQQVPSAFISQVKCFQQAIH